MGEMRRAIDREERERHKTDRFASTLVIAASVIAAFFDPLNRATIQASRYRE
jgi:hypothetical protein